MNRDPKRTVALLDELRALGFNDAAFAVLHHMPDHAIDTHRAYCLDTGTFKKDDNNAKVQQRLEKVLAAYKGGGFTNPDAFGAIAHAVAVEIPVKQNKAQQRGA